MTTPSSAINNLDLSPIANRVIEKYGWSQGEAEEIAEQYRRLWYVRLKYPDAVLVPFQELDLFWHEHILFTRKYAADCHKVFGRFFHHQPGDGSSAFHEYLEDSEKHQKPSQVDLIENYWNTVALIEKEFPDVR